MFDLRFPAPALADPTLTQRLAVCLHQVLRVVGAQERGNPLVAAVARLLLGRVSRIGGRFAALLAKFEAGTLPARKPSRRRVPAAPDAPDSPGEHGRPSGLPRPPGLPSGRGWLLKLLGWQVAWISGNLALLLEDPRMQALLAAAPQAARLLRPLFRMLSSGPLPESLRLPPRPPRPRRPRPPRPPRAAGPTDAQIRRSLGLPARAPRDRLAHPPPAAAPPASGPPLASATAAKTAAQTAAPPPLPGPRVFG